MTTSSRIRQKPQLYSAPRGVRQDFGGRPGVEFSIADFGLDFIDFLEFEGDVSANSPVFTSREFNPRRAIRAELGRLGRAPASVVLAACVGRLIASLLGAFLRDVSADSLLFASGGPFWAGLAHVIRS